MRAADSVVFLALLSNLFLLLYLDLRVLPSDHSLVFQHSRKLKWRLGALRELREEENL
jgi:hypothetical protein